MSEIISLPYQGSKTKFYESGHEIEIFASYLTVFSLKGRRPIW